MSNPELEHILKMERDAETMLREVRAKREHIELVEREGRLEPLKAVAIRAHDVLCRWNHTDGCSWVYESDGPGHNWRGWAHDRWLRQMEKLTTGDDKGGGVSVETINAILDCIAALKTAHPDALWLLRYRMEP